MRVMEIKKFFRISTTLIVLATLLVACGRNSQATSTPEMLALPTPSSTPLPDSFPTEALNSTHCATIAFPQPRNAYRAWLALDRPENMTFHNDFGPDGDGSETPVTKDTLPTLVHVGDSICAPAP